MKTNTPTRNTVMKAAGSDNTKQASVTYLDEKRDAGKKPKTASSTIPAIAWMGLSEQELLAEGGVLLAWLSHEAGNRGLTQNGMANELGVTSGYISQLRSGTRNVQDISDYFAVQCARFLNKPKFAVLLAAGKVQPEDSFENQEVLKNEVNAAVQHIRENEVWSDFVTDKAHDLNLRAKLALVTAYEIATGTQLLCSRNRMEDLHDQGAQSGLMEWVYGHAKGLKRKDLAEDLGCKPSYLGHLASGVRKTENISKKFSAACARFLRVPRLAVLLAAGKVRFCDLGDRHENREAVLERAMRFIFMDPQWGARLPAGIWFDDSATREMFVRAYEKATGCRLITTADEQERNEQGW